MEESGDSPDHWPDHGQWTDDSAYSALTQADRATLAWEFGRRLPDGPMPGDAALVQIAPHIFEVDPCHAGILPGLRFALPAAGPAALALVQWDWNCDPSVLPVMAVPAKDGFDLRATGLTAIVLRDAVAEHVLIADGAFRLRLAVLDGTLLEGPVRFHYSLPGNGDCTHLLALRRLMDLRRTGCLSPVLCRPSCRASRWAVLLRAWDAHCAGASQRDIACLLWGEARVRDDWNGRSDYMRMRVHRMIHGADRLVHGGWRHLLR